MNTIRLKFEQLSEQTAEILTALLSQANASGFESEGLSFYAYFPESDFDAESIASLLTPYTVTYATETIPPQNWNARWEENFEPVIVNDTVGVRAHFHPPFAHLPYEIEITPKMSFGTGHHATTQLMLQCLCDMDLSGKTVFDFGCGTGVLAIFAALKGAASVLGTDNDEWSVLNALENCERNHCLNIAISAKDIGEINDTFDVVLANINLNILLQYAVKLFSITKPRGRLFLSGVMVSDREKIVSAFAAAGFITGQVRQQKEWIAVECLRAQ